jgi:peroxiredoxin (alkyl hydroperoxide reductase subunit C)
MRKGTTAIILLTLALLLAGTASAEVLGPCGTPDAEAPAAATVEQSTAPSISPIPLPGEQAPNFELSAVVGDEVRKIKLSDYDGKWRVLCFYPADFTFV